MIDTYDIINYYFGCMYKYTWLSGEVVYAKLEDILSDISFICGTPEWIEEDGIMRKPVKDIDDWFEINDVRKEGKMELILTDTSDMTKSQMREYKNLCYKIFDLHNNEKIVRYADTPLSMHYLFRNHIDAFDLIENHQAIDKKQYEMKLQNVPI